MQNDREVSTKKVPEEVSKSPSKPSASKATFKGMFTKLSSNKLTKPEIKEEGEKKKLKKKQVAPTVDPEMNEKIKTMEISLDEINKKLFQEVNRLETVID